MDKVVGKKLTNKEFHRDVVNLFLTVIYLSNIHETCCHIQKYIVSLAICTVSEILSKFVLSDSLKLLLKVQD
jgi:hypothetical protein